MPKTTKTKEKKAKACYCFACGFPVNDTAMQKWLKKNKLNSLAKILERLSLPKKITKKKS